MRKDYWINPQLIELFNEHLNLAVSKLEKDGCLCPIIAFIDKDEVKTYSQNIKKPKDFPKLNEMHNIVKGVKDGDNIKAAAIIYNNDYNGKKVIQFDLEHRCGDCITILVPYAVKGLFNKKLQLESSNKYIIQTCNSFVGWCRDIREKREKIENLKAKEVKLITSINYFSESIKNNEIAADRVGFVKWVMWGDKLKLFIIRYAMGKQIELLAKEFDELLHDALTEWDGGVMSQMLNVSSLCVLFHTSKEMVEKIENIINKQLNYYTQEYNAKKNPFYYWLVDYLLQAAKGEGCKEYTKDKMNVPFYNKLCEAVSGRNDIESALKTYVSEWWKTPRTKHFIDMFNKNDSVFWCFEAAALAALFHINTDIFKDSLCFPVDLVEYYQNNHRPADKQIEEL